MTWLIQIAASLVGKEFARLAVYAALAFALIAAAFILKAGYDRRLTRQHDAQQSVGAAKTNAAAHQTAATERADDLIRNAEDERKRREAIETAPVGAPDAATIQLGCERLRQAGIPTDQFAACR
jgi:hypothetical protein